MKFFDHYLGEERTVSIYASDFDETYPIRLHFRGDLDSFYELLTVEDAEQMIVYLQKVIDKVKGAKNE